jgi:hypothetical protein
MIKDFISFLTGFRKFTFGILFVLVALGLLFSNKVTGSEVITTMRDVVVAFMATNVCAKIIGATTAWIKKKK